MGAVRKLVEEQNEKVVNLYVEQPPIEVEESERVIVPSLGDAVGRVKESVNLRLEVYGEWISGGTSFVVKRFREGARALWGAIWQGNIFPLRMQIVDYETGKDELVNARFIGKLSGLIVVCVINSFVLTFRYKKFLVAAGILGILSLFSGHAWDAFQLVVIAVAVIYFPLGFWKARSYRGLKRLVVEGLDGLIDTKKSENSGE